MLTTTDSNLKTFTVDPEGSTLAWTGRNILGGSHVGSLRFARGTLQLNGNNLVRAEFDVDMQSLGDEDLPDAALKSQLVNHLKSEDFFHVMTYPVASFKLLSAVPVGNSGYDVIGNITIRGTTQEIKFPAQVHTEGEKAVAKASLTLDRTKFGIRFGSPSFFTNLGDKAVQDKFDLELVIVAAK